MQPWTVGASLLGFAVGMTLLAFLLPAPSYKINVAFVGNSMQFVNDLPRFMQAISGESHQGGYNIEQDSCLHGSLKFKSLLKKGNGMRHKWNTPSSLLSEDPDIYDYGACTVAQLILGYDSNLQAGNANEYYKNDGKNPCFKSQDYYDYLMEKYDGTTIPQWDFVVLNDQSLRPAIEEKRSESLYVLEESYVPMLLESGAIPVFYATHGYDSTYVNVTEMGGVAQFTSDVFEGYRQYAEMMEEYLPSSQRPRIAPVGLAFLVVYEENPEMYEKLFFVDGYHPSPHGSYLMGCVLYATLYGYMPGNAALPAIPETLWSRARRMQIGNKHVMPFPTYEEAIYLYSVARKIMIYGARPETWVRYFVDSESDYIVGSEG